MNKRSFAIVALSTICLATILAAVPTNSLVGYYDPWLDYDDNGDIDMKDVAASARAFGSFGDPTKNVSVVNWPVSDQVVVWSGESLGMGEGLFSEEYDSSGFSQLHILVYIYGLGIFPIEETMWFVVRGKMFIDSAVEIDPFYYEATFTGTNNYQILVMPVPSQIFSFYIQTDDSSDGNVYLNFYLTWA